MMMEVFKNIDDYLINHGQSIHFGNSVLTFITPKRNKFNDWLNYMRTGRKDDFLHRSHLALYGKFSKFELKSMGKYDHAMDHDRLSWCHEFDIIKNWKRITIIKNRYSHLLGNINLVSFRKPEDEIAYKLMWHGNG